MTKHYIYGGSTASRTLNCAAWQAKRKTMPTPPTSYLAQLGTSLHAIIERCLNDVDIDPISFVGEKVEGVEITIEHIQEKIDPALVAFEELMIFTDVYSYWTEIEASISEEEGGTADFFAISQDGKTAVVADYKSGDGVMVDAENNAQGLFYLMCLMLSPTTKHLFEGVEKFVIAVVQPSPRREEILDHWETDIHTVNDFIARHRAAVEASKQPDPQPTCGSHCRWCPAEALCNAQIEIAQQAQELGDAAKLSGQLEQALAMAAQLDPWIKAVRKMAHEQIEEGLNVEGWKLVPKRAMRSWNDKDELSRRLKNANKIKYYEDACDVKVKSPAQIEKLCKAKGVDFKKFDDLITSMSSGTTLVPASDKRQQVETLDVSNLGAELKKLENVR